MGATRVLTGTFYTTKMGEKKEALIPRISANNGQRFDHVIVYSFFSYSFFRIYNNIYKEHCPTCDSKKYNTV